MEENDSRGPWGSAEAQYVRVRGPGCGDEVVPARLVLRVAQRRGAWTERCVCAVPCCRESGGALARSPEPLAWRTVGEASACLSLGATLAARTASETARCSSVTPRPAWFVRSIEAILAVIYAAHVAQ